MLYQERFENLFRVALKITASLNISNILETIRDEAKVSIPNLQEACLLLVDPDAANYTRPLHCSMSTELINCQMCKRGRSAITASLENPGAYLCVIPGPDGSKMLPSSTPIDGLSEVAIPIYHDGEPLAVLNAVAKQDSKITERDLILLKDLTDLASNVITNAKKHWKVSQQKLTVDRILGHLRPFVPQTVQKIVDKNPDSPSLDKIELEISVLFLDVAGYTRISESLNQDQVNFIIEKYFSSFLDIIYEHSGDINETAGDGLMVIFQGDPIQTALNAGRAALDIRRRTAEINEEMKGRFQPIVINMGINSGIASVGMSRFQGKAGTRMTFTASGSVTNLAARLAAEATGGDILVGPDTAKRIGDQLILYPRGAMKFKNVSSLTQVYSLAPGNRGQSDFSGEEQPG
ncbi:MAG: adenylate/guanylate cyclase domain-containing protein [Desulfomonilaceae bacterium]